MLVLSPFASRVRVGAILCATLAPFWAQAQSAPGGNAPAAAPAAGISAPSTTIPVAAVSTNFRLQPGDVVSVQIANHPEMSALETPVAANGQLALPIIGALPAVGRTLGQVQSAVLAAARKQLVNPQVTLTLVRSVPRQLTILGAIGRPGPLDVRPGLRLSEALAAAGGLTVKPDEVKVTLLRPKTAPRTLDVETALNAPQSAANVVVKAGDTLSLVPLPTLSIAISGDGAVPGIQQLRLSKTRAVVRVSDVILAAGGLRNKAERTRGYLLRGGQKIALDVTAALKNGPTPANPILRDRDEIVLDFIEPKKIDVAVIALDNVVKGPGNFSFEDEVSFSKLIVQAGGLAVPADQVNASIRRDKQSIPVNIERAALDASADPLLQNGDIVILTLNDAPRVRLSGTFVKPDTYRVPKGSTVMDAVINAGGFIAPESSSLRVLRTGADGKPIVLEVDAQKLFGLKDLSENFALQDGDLLVAGPLKRTRTIYISGEVNAPGGYELNEGDGLPELLLRAGGPKPTAALRQVSINSRDKTVKKVDVGSALKPGGAPLPITLEENDFVNVPVNPARVLVMNAVAAPGYYPVPETGGLTVGDALLAAGGARADAKLQQVTVVRRVGNATQRQLVALDAVKNGNLTINFPLQAGDVVYVPTRGQPVNVLGTVGKALGIFGAFHGLFGF